MKILMFGRGVIATIYGWTLEQAGHDVEFYVRPGRGATYGDAIDLDIIDARNGMRGQRIRRSWPVRFRETLESGHDFDMIVLSVGHHRLTEAVEFLTPRLGRATVLIFGNVWAEPLDAIGAIPPERVAWGFPQAGGGFDNDGVLSGMLLRSAVFGTINQSLNARERDVRHAFRQAGFRTHEKPDFRGWLWIHFVADAGMLSQGLKAGTLSKMVGSTSRLRDALLTSRELLPLLEARGINLRLHRRSVMLFRAPAWLTAAAMSWATAHISALGRSLQAHNDPDTEEPRRVCRDTLSEARRLGISAPRLEAAEPSFAAAPDTGERHG